jgi:hypothetical protein
MYASKEAEWQFRLDRRSLGVLHLKAIARVYGEYGGEVLEVRTPAAARGGLGASAARQLTRRADAPGPCLGEWFRWACARASLLPTMPPPTTRAPMQLLRKNPAGAIPVILTRLKQKDEEWRRARLEVREGGVRAKGPVMSL